MSVSTKPVSVGVRSNVSTRRPLPACVEPLESRRHLTVVTFKLSPSLSLATLSPAGDISLAPQAKESLTACYTGKIRADVGTNSFQLLTGDSIVGMGEYTGKAKPGNKPADFSTIAGGLLDASLRDLVFGVKSASISVGAGGAFKNGSETIYVQAGRIDFAGINGLSLKGSESLVGLSAKNKISKPGHLTIKGSVETITIPLKATVTFAFSPLLKSQFTFTGQLVASAKVPKA